MAAITLPKIMQSLGRAVTNFLFGSNNTRLLNTFVMQLGTPEVYIDINAIKAIDEGFNKSTAVYSIVMKFAAKFGAIPRYLYDAKAKEEKSGKAKYQRKFLAPDNTKFDDNHPLVKLLNRPNPDESQDAFFTKVCAYCKTCGEAMIWLNRGDIEQYRLPDGSFDDMAIDKLPVLEMRVLPAEFVNPVPDPESVWDILGWILNAGGLKIAIRKGDVIHWKSTSLKFDLPLREHLRGFSPLAAGYKTLQQNNSMSDAAVRMAQNDGARGVMINKTIGASQNPTQQSQVKKVFNAKINNNEVKGAIAALEGDWTYENFGQTATDMQLMEGKQMTWQELCFLLCVPYEFFDSKTTFANKEIALKGWVSNDIMPACKQLDGEMNRMLLPAFGINGAAFIASDASDLPEMQIDMAAMVTAMQNAYWCTPNEKREMIGEEPSDDPAMDEFYFPQGLVALKDMGADQEMQDLQTQLTAIRNGKPTNGKPVAAN